jgi:hypothetical protein
VHKQTTTGHAVTSREEATRVKTRKTKTQATKNRLKNAFPATAALDQHQLVFKTCDASANKDIITNQQYGDSPPTLAQWARVN